MKTSTVTRTAVIAIVALAVALTASSAWGDVVLRRDASKAVPFQAHPGTSGHRAVLRRDGSRAVPFVASVERPGAAQADGFDWGDAAVGAGAGLALALAGVAALAAYGGRRAQTT